MKVTISTPTTSADYEMTTTGLIELTKLALMYSIEHDAKKILDKTPEPSPAFKKITITTPPATKETAVAEKPMPTISDTQKQYEPKAPAGYTGFILVECVECGKIHGFFTKVPVVNYTCKRCDATFELHSMRSAFVECKCGTKIRYKTNSRSRVISLECFKCYAPVDLELNEHNGTYVTMKEKRKHH